MNTKLLMIACALLMAVSGVLLQFMPHEILHYFGVDSNGINALFVQITGALYLGFAMMNWMAKSVLVGGIYSRPLALDNFFHFTVGALALVKYVIANSSSAIIWVSLLIYSLFAVLFGFVVFTHPLKTRENAGN